MGWWWLFCQGWNELFLVIMGTAWYLQVPVQTEWVELAVVFAHRLALVSISLFSLEFAWFQIARSRKSSVEGSVDLFIN